MGGALAAITALSPPASVCLLAFPPARRSAAERSPPPVPPRISVPQKYQPPRQGRRLSATKKAKGSSSPSSELLVITTVAYGDNVVACKVWDPDTMTWDWPSNPPEFSECKDWGAGLAGLGQSSGCAGGKKPHGKHTSKHLFPYLCPPSPFRRSYLPFPPPHPTPPSPQPPAARRSPPPPMSRSSPPSSAPTPSLRATRSAPPSRLAAARLKPPSMRSSQPTAPARRRPVTHMVRGWGGEGRGTWRHAWQAAAAPADCGALKLHPRRALA